MQLFSKKRLVNFNQLASRFFDSLKGRTAFTKAVRPLFDSHACSLKLQPGGRGDVNDTCDLELLQALCYLKQKVNKIFCKVGQIALPVPDQGQTLKIGAP